MSYQGYPYKLMLQSNAQATRETGKSKDESYIINFLIVTHSYRVAHASGSEVNIGEDTYGPSAIIRLVLN